MLSEKIIRQVSFMLVILTLHSGSVFSKTTNKGLILDSYLYQKHANIGDQVEFNYILNNAGKKNKNKVQFSQFFKKNLFRVADSDKLPNNCKFFSTKITCNVGIIYPGSSVGLSFSLESKVDQDIVINAQAKSKDELLKINKLTANQSKNNRLKFYRDFGDTSEFEIELREVSPNEYPINYLLNSKESDVGYSNAYFKGNKLFISAEAGFIGSFYLNFSSYDGHGYNSSGVVEIVNFNNINSTPNEGSLGLEAITKSQLEEHITNTGSYTESNILALSTPSKTQLPSGIDLSGFFPKPGNQGNLGSCVAWATGYALKSYQEGQEMKWDLTRNNHLFSPSYIFNQIKLDNDGKNGSYITDALKLLKTQGDATLSTMPYSENDPYTQPSSKARKEAALYRSGDYRAVKSRNEIKSNIASGQPVVAGITIYTDFFYLNKSNPVYNSTNGILEGYHAVTIVGYDDNKYGGAYKIINSWGTGFGENGFFWMPYSFSESVTKDYKYILFEAWSQYDKSNPNPPPLNNLPNLQIKDWTIERNQNPAGIGWTIINTGTLDAAPGFDATLMLSADKMPSKDDIVIYRETIPYTVGSLGKKIALRNNRFTLANIPKWLPNGDYYLYLNVDSLNKVEELNEADNISFASSKISLSGNMETSDPFVNDFSVNISNNSFGFQIYNRGNSKVLSGWKAFLTLLDVNSGGYVLAGNSYQNELLPNESYSLNSINFKDIPLFIKDGVYQFVLELDYTDKSSTIGNVGAFYGDLACIKNHKLTNCSGVNSSGEYKLNFDNKDSSFNIMHSEDVVLFPINEGTIELTK